LAIFGPVLKFILVDYAASLVMILVVYSLVLKLIAKVSVRQFWRYAFESFLIAFSTCTSAAALPVAMKNSRRMGIPKQVGNFVLPLGATANMNGTCIYFGIIVVFASQLYGVPLSFGQQVMLAITATLLSVGAAATPQIGLVISITLLSSMGLPLEATALVAGVYRIIDQIHTGTNSVGDLVFATAIAEMEGVLDHDLFENFESAPDELDDDNLLALEETLATRES
jgi:Na+/H+-dicarboxylate symporter